MEFKIDNLPEEGTLKISGEVAQKLKEIGFGEDFESGENQDFQEDTKDKK